MLFKPNCTYKILIVLAMSLLLNPALFGLDKDIRNQLDGRDNLRDQFYFLDSLIKHSTEMDDVYFKAILLKSELLRKEEKDVEALLELKKISENESASSFPSILGEAYLSTSEIYSKERSYDLARNYLTEAYILFDGLNSLDLKAITLIKSADIERREENYSAAIRHLKQAHEIYLELGKTYAAIEIAQKIGTIAYEGGEFTEAEHYLKLALNGFEQSNDVKEQLKILESLAGIYEFEKRYNEKIDLQQRLIEISFSSNSNHKATQYLQQLSNTYTLLNRNRDALLTQEQAVNNLSNEHSRDKYYALIRLSELYKLGNRETDAILTLHQANNLAITMEDGDVIISSSKIIADFYKERGEWEKAHHYLALSDSIGKSLLYAKIRRLENSPNQQSVIPLTKDSKASMDRIITTKGPLIQYTSLPYLIGFAVAFIILLVAFIFQRKKNLNISRILEWKFFKRTKELRLLNSELNTYIYKSSHDLRNPLTSIKSLITLLKSEENFDQSTKYITLIENCANQMDEILLNLSRAVDYKKVEVKIEQVDFSHLKSELNSVVQDGELSGINLSWNIREKAPFFSDPNLIKVILNKTILNSAQYRLGSSSDFCKISITTDSTGASVCVEDNGQGIAEKVKDSVFEMFVKGTHKSKGAGLGLYLVKIASDKIRGKITLESEENKGSKLLFKLPNLS